MVVVVLVIMGMPVIVPMTVMVVVIVPAVTMAVIMMMIMRMFDRCLAVAAAADRTHQSTSSSLTRISSPPVTCN
ncbi:unnamed protein product [marine sediment metagenome]|uniref:Uncharacterized protein n=1 Tax=marine sediment metagenome TaxID=412755 RepID=X1J8S2_9ZZZZ